jgi:hypothetical protein
MDEPGYDVSAEGGDEEDEEQLLQTYHKTATWTLEDIDKVLFWQ